MYKHTFRYEITIDAPVGLVWQVLTAFGEYPDWHPFTPVVHVEPRAGGKVRQQVVMELLGRTVIHRARVSTWLPNDRMAWKMSYGPLVRAERVQKVEECGQCCTLYRTVDINRGWLVPWIRNKYGPSIDLGFQNLSVALKRRCEAKFNNE